MRKMTQAEFDMLNRDKDGYLVIPAETDCTEIDFRCADRVDLGNGCELGSGCRLGDRCLLGDDCRLGSGCRLGDACLIGDRSLIGSGCELGDDCTLGDWCRLGSGCRLGDWCRMGDGCELGDMCRLGNWCRLGSGCKLGDRCLLGDGCKLGRGCELGDRCSLSEYINVRATFEDGRVRDGLYVQIGNIGHEHRTAYFYIDKDGSIFVCAGDWFGDLNDLKECVKGVYGGTIYETQYMAACAYAETVLPQMLKESDASRMEGKTHDND